MRIARYFIQGKAVTGQLNGDWLHLFLGDSLEEIEPQAAPLSVAGEKPLPPCRPGKVFGIGAELP